MKLPIKIRYAKNKDINKVLELWSEFMKEHNKFFKLGIHPTKKNIKTCKKWFRKKIKLKELVVAECDKELAGYILFYKYEFPLETDFTTGFISDMFVQKQYRSLGIGKKLMDKAHQILIRRKCDRASLQVICQNYKAVKLYKKLGYKNRSIGMYKKLK